MKHQPIEKCKLCEKEKELIKRSHIIPKFLFKSIKGNGNQKFYELNPISNVKIITKKLSDNYYESGILCYECENLFSKFETYFSRLMNDIKLSNNINIYNDYEVLDLSIDYKMTKLFLLSILWKSSISNHRFFKIVDLGIHNEKIRNLILSNLDEVNDYYQVLVCYLKEGSQFEDSILPIEKSKLKNITQYVFTINRFTFIFLVGNDEVLRKIDLGSFSLNITGNLKIILLNHKFRESMFNSFYYKNQKIRPKFEINKITK